MVGGRDSESGEGEGPRITRMTRMGNQESGEDGRACSPSAPRVELGQLGELSLPARIGESASIRVIRGQSLVPPGALPALICRDAVQVRAAAEEELLTDCYG